jgi:hypothetical protein
MLRTLLLLPALLAACAGPATDGRLDPRAPVAAGPGGVEQACRSRALAVLARQDRGQLLREDERDSRIGVDAGLAGLRSNIDQLGRQYRFDQMVRDCVRNSAPDQRPAAPQPRS